MKEAVVDGQLEAVWGSEQEAVVDGQLEEVSGSVKEAVVDGQLEEVSGSVQENEEMVVGTQPEEVWGNQLEDK